MKAVNNEGYGVIDFALIAREPVNSKFGKTAVQTGVDFLPTQTRYSFVCGPVDLEVTFTAPFLPDDLELTGRPVNYISYNVKSRDGKKHQVSFMLSASPLFACDYVGQPTEESIMEYGGLTLMRTGTSGQRILEKWGDDPAVSTGDISTLPPTTRIPVSPLQTNALHLTATWGM